jgi:rod shape-determining protein MreB
LVVRNASSGAVFDEVPIVTVSSGPKRRVLGVGSAARAASSNCVNPFQHPRILIADFLAAEALLKYAFHAVTPRTWVQPSPIAVCHVVEPLAGGLSQIESRALMEMMEGAGARSAFLWEGRELTDVELLSGAYRSAGT